MLSGEDITDGVKDTLVGAETGASISQQVLIICCLGAYHAGNE